MLMIQERLEGFDGLRALAIGSTVWMHLMMTGSWQSSLPLSWGRQGVALFFALSGYLITLSLQGDGDLKRFYGKRAAKILPSLYVYLAFVLVLWLAGTYVFPGVSLLAAATCWLNWYSGERGWPLEHIWSLSAEEQFYLVWPLVFGWGKGRAAGLVSAVLFAWPLQRWLRTGRLGHPTVDAALFSVTFDTILWGCLGALIMLRWPAWIKPWANRRAGILPFCLFASLLLWGESLSPVLVPGLRGLAFAWIFIWLTCNQSAWLTKILGWAPLAWIGRRSYSIYLWHILFCDPRIISRVGLPGSLLLGLGTACVLYQVIERGTKSQSQ